MDLKVLGCHGGETPRHRTSSFLLGDHLAIDAGAITGALSLREQQLITSVLVSHPHMDHVRDLATLADNRCQQGGPPIEIVGIPDTIKALKRHFFNDRLWPDFSKIMTPGGPTVTYRKVKPDKTIEVGGMQVTPVLVTHTIDTAGYIIADDSGSIAYSGDTGPTKHFWDVLNRRDDLRALLMEVSFPNEQDMLAKVSGHHTPATLAAELEKLKNHPDLPILLYHIKPVFQAKVEKQLAKIKKRNLQILQLEDQFLF